MFSCKIQILVAGFRFAAGLEDIIKFATFLGVYKILIKQETIKNTKIQNNTRTYLSQAGG